MSRAGHVELGVTIAGRSFPTPVFTASGTAGNGEELAKLIDMKKLGALVTKSVSLEPRSGHPSPRTVETAAGMLNCIGLQNAGIDAYVEERLPALAQLPCPVILNVVGHDIESIVAVIERLATEAPSNVAMLEINMSCPNVERGVDQGSDPGWVGECTAATKAVAAVPVMVKLTPNTHDIAALARAAEHAGADAVSAINTLVGMSVDIYSFRPRLSNVTGGLSGPAIKPVALACVYKIARAVAIPVIGIGGISCGLDAVEFLLVGASAVQVGTEIFRNPDAPLRVAAEIRDYLAQRGMSSVGELVGALKV